MANAMKGEAEVTLKDGRKLQLVFDVNAWIDIEEETGLHPQKLVDLLQSATDDTPVPLKLQRAVIWGGLRKHHPEMTPRDAGEVMVEAAQAMEKALTGGMPQTEEDSADDADANPRKKNGRGTASATVGAVLA